MAAITARWSRGVQIDGELETLGLEVVLGTTEADPTKVLLQTVEMGEKLALAGDALVLERLATRQRAKEGPRTARVQRPGTAKAKAPDVVQRPAEAPPEPIQAPATAPAARTPEDGPYLLG